MRMRAPTLPPAPLQGPRLLAAITSVCASGFLLFGYDQGVMSGIILSPSWLTQMSSPSTPLIGTMTALYDVGAFLGALAAALSSERLGRRRTLVVGAGLAGVGAALMGSAFGRGQFMFARVVTGLGVGFCTSAAPVYQAEVVGAGRRGWGVCCQCSTMLFGLMVAYWIDYALFFREGGLQWRFPLVFQVVFAGYVLAVAPFLPDSPRWLVRRDGVGDPRRGAEVLARLRGKAVGHPDVRAEVEAIVEAIRIEAGEEAGWGDLLRSNGVQAHKRFGLAVGIQFMQQLSGINIVTYYAPTLFKSSLGFSSQLALLMGCFLQVWYLLASLVTWYMIDRFGRRPLFITCAFGMCLVLVLEAICVAVGGTGASIAAVVFVFLFEACFTWGWMGTVWVYPPEILPLNIRAKGSALAAAADFLGNFLVVEITPPALQNIGWKTYVIFAVFNVVNGIVVWMFYPETSDIPLEAIDFLFMERDSAGSPDERQRGNRLQWSIVRKADDEVKRQRCLRKANPEHTEGPQILDGETTSAKSDSEA